MVEPLGLTALVYDGVMARAYLSHLRAHGFLFERILFLSIRQSRGNFWPSALSGWYANRAQAAAAMYWVKRLPKLFPDLHAVMTKKVSDCYGLPSEFYTSLTDKFKYSDFARDVVEVRVDGLSDPVLKRAFDALPALPVLFTGGGIMPSQLVSNPQRPVLHVHPGLLPEVRGADGLLWSTAVLGRPTASCFVMAAGLDTGAVLATAEFPALTFPVNTEKRPDPKSLYRLLYAYYDPILRAKLLTDVVKRHGAIGLSSAIANATQQDLTLGRTYNFMHPTLRNAVMERIFPSGV